MASLYSWKDAVKRHHVISAEDANRELERIKLTTDLVPGAVVDAARPVNAVLHPEFEWVDTIAAEEWRKEQARHLIGGIVVTVPSETNKPPLQIRAYASVSEPVPGGAPHYHFVKTTHVITEPDIRRQLLENAFREIEALRRRYAALEELNEIFEKAAAKKKELNAA